MMWLIIETENWQNMFALVGTESSTRYFARNFNVPTFLI